MVLRYAVAGFGICRQIRNICIRNFSSTTYWVGGKITTIINIKKLERKQSFECPSLKVMLRCEFFLWQRVSASKWFLLHDSLFAQRVWSTKFSFVTFHIGNHTTTNQQNERTQTLAMSIIQIVDRECLLLNGILTLNDIVTAAILPSRTQCNSVLKDNKANYG